MKKNIIASITITYNPEIQILKKQLLSLSNQVQKVIVVDNYSSNINEVKKLLLEIGNNVLIELSDNKGIAYAQNEGIAYARNNGFGHIILFDHDSEISDNFISELLEAERELLQKGYKVGAIGPVFSDATTGRLYPVAKFKSDSKYSGFFLQRIYLDKNNQYSEVYLLIASGCLIRMEVLDEVGDMDSSLFIDNVDAEWCYRVRSYGYKTFASSRVNLVHRIGEGTRKFLGKKFSIHSNIRKYYNTRNNLELLRYNYVPLGAKIRGVIRLFLMFLVGFLDTENIRNYVHMYYRAIKDFLLHKSGKY